MALEDSLLVRINSLKSFTCCGKFMAEPKKTVSFEDVIFCRARPVDAGFRRAKDLILAHLWTVIAASRGICAELTERETGDVTSGGGRGKGGHPRSVSQLFSTILSPAFFLSCGSPASHLIGYRSLATM